MDVDVDLHGVVTIRVIGGHVDDLIRRAPHVAGVPQVADGGDHADPDIVVRLVDELPGFGVVRRLGGHALADDDGLILQRRTGRVRLRFAPARRWELVCERAGDEIPLLLPLVRAAALTRGVVSFHGTAFVDEGRGAVTTGWSSSGKTGALLSVLAGGGKSVASECVLVGPDGDGDSLLGMRQPIRIKPSHMERWPELTRFVPPRELRRFRRRSAACRMVARAARALGDSATGRTADSLSSLLEQRLHVDVESSAASMATAPFDALLIVENADVEGVVVDPVRPDVAAVRLTQLFEQDTAELMACYRLARYADPSTGDKRIETLAATYAELVRRKLADRPTFAIRYRQPVPFDALHSAIKTALAR